MTAGHESITTTGTVPPNGAVLIEAFCTAGKRPVGGNYSVNAGSFFNAYSATLFAPTSNSWRLGVQGVGTAPGSATISVTVHCAILPP